MNKNKEDKKFIILLPNSKSKNEINKFEKYQKIEENKSKNKDNFFISLNKNRNFIYKNLLNILKEKNKEELKKVFDIKNEKKLDFEISNIKNFKNLETNFSIMKFSGVMFKAINYKEMKKENQKNFNNNVIFIDALFGMLKPLDKIPNYKLEFTTKFNFNLKKYWAENLKSIFENYIKKDYLIIDILPQSHKVFLSEKMISINFFEKKENGELKNTGHISKILKGDLINYLSQFEKLSIKDIKKFKHKDGFKFCKKNSTNKEFKFVK
jgi:cytoplasmic iron level regulating protein YaaA (DUF328/UPF0246 family)